MNISPFFGELTTPLRHILPIHNVTINSNNLLWISAGRSHLRWEIAWRNAPCIWRDFGSALPFQTRLTQIKPVLSLSKSTGQGKDQGRRHCCHNKHKKFPIGLHVMYLYFPDTPRIKLNISYKTVMYFMQRISDSLDTTPLPGVSKLCSVWSARYKK